MSEQEKTLAEQKREALLMERKNGWDRVDETVAKAMEEYCVGYKTYLDRGKTERRAVDYTVELAKAAGFKPYERGMKLNPGDKVYRINRGKAIVLAVIAHPLWWWALAGWGIGLGAIYVYFLVPTLFAVFSDWKNIKLSFPGKILLILAHPIYYMGYIPVMRRALFSKKNRHTWVAIDRGDFSKGR